MKSLLRRERKQKNSKLKIVKNHLYLYTKLSGTISILKWEKLAEKERKKKL